MNAQPHIISFNQESAHLALQRDPLGEYLSILQTENKSPRTLKAYRGDLEAFRVWFGCPIERADTVVLQKYFSTLSDLSPAALARKQTSLAMFFHWCLLMEVIDKNPMAVIRRAKVPKRLPRPLDDGRLKRFFTAVSTGCMRDKLLFILLMETGLRISEALGLRWEAVDLTEGNEKLIVLGKGQKERAIPLETAPITLGLLGRLREEKEGHLPIFVGQPGQALSYSQAHRLFREYANAAGLPETVTLHSLRHTYATNLLEDGVNIAVAQKLLGHADIKTTTLYQGVSDQFVRIELLKQRSRLIDVSS